MITEPHLNHWLNEMKYQLVSIGKEIREDKLKDVKGVTVPVDNGNTVFVSFEYIREKAFTLAGLIRCIESDMNNDGKELE